MLQPLIWILLFLDDREMLAFRTPLQNQCFSVVGFSVIVLVISGADLLIFYCLRMLVILHYYSKCVTDCFMFQNSEKTFHD